MGNTHSVSKKNLETPNKISLSNSLLRFVSELEHEERYHLFLGSCGLLVNALTNMMYPRMIGLMIDTSELGKPVALEKCPEYNFPVVVSALSNFYSKFDGLNPDCLFNRVLLYSIPVYIAGSLASWFRVYHTNTAIYLIQKRCRQKVFKKILSQNLFFFHSHTSNYLLAKLLNDCDEGPRAFVESYTYFLRSCNSTVGGTCHLFSISPSLTLVTLLSAPLIGATIRFLSKFVKTSHFLKKEQIDKVMAKAEEVIMGIENVISFSREDNQVESFMRSLDKCDRVSLLANNCDGLLMGSILASFNISTLVMIYFGSRQMKTGNLSMGKFASFIIYGGLIGLGAAGLSRVYSQLVKASAAMESVYEVTDLDEIEDNSLILEEVRGNLEIKNLSFEYPNREGLVLEGISLKIEAGEVIAIVGPSGAGKTTLCKLISTIYKPTKGEIFLDSNDISQLSSKWLRSSVFSVVSQEPVLFSVSIEENIKYGNWKATREEVIQVSKECNLHNFIESLPEKYETKVGSRGVTLSTGQKQRIALARAMLKNAPILILDEPTSSLDGFSEELVAEAIKLDCSDKTLIIVSHKPEIVSRARKVAVLNRGLEYFGPVSEAKTESETFKSIFPSI